MNSISSEMDWVGIIARSADGVTYMIELEFSGSGDGAELEITLGRDKIERPFDGDPWRKYEPGPLKGRVVAKGNAASAVRIVADRPDWDAITAIVTGPRGAA